jgi:DNA-binding transcriptional MerR regulator
VKLDKKYYSISEVSSYLQIPMHALRYLEKSVSCNLSINKVKNRRYYTKEDIKNLETLQSKAPDGFLDRIDRLIGKFKSLAARASS